MLTVSVNASTFTVSDGTDFLTKDKENIFVCVGSNADIVEIWETTPIESQRNLIVASKYDNFSSPTGTTAASIVNEIADLISYNYDSSGVYVLNGTATISSGGTYYCNGTFTVTLDTNAITSNSIVQIYNIGSGTVTVSGGGSTIRYSPATSVMSYNLTNQYDSLTLQFYTTYFLVR